MIIVIQPQVCSPETTNTESCVKNFELLTAAMPQNTFRTPATASRIPANNHQPVTLAVLSIRVSFVEVRAQFPALGGGGHRPVGMRCQLGGPGSSKSWIRARHSSALATPSNT